MDSDFRFEYYPDEIAEVLCKLADFEPKGAIFNNVNEALYHWKAVCENPYNFDFYRVFWKVLESIVEIDNYKK